MTIAPISNASVVKNSKLKTLAMIWSGSTLGPLFRTLIMAEKLHELNNLVELLKY